MASASESATRTNEETRLQPVQLDRRSAITEPNSQDMQTGTGIRCMGDISPTYTPEQARDRIIMQIREFQNAYAKAESRLGKHSSILHACRTTYDRFKIYGQDVSLMDGAALANLMRALIDAAKDLNSSLAETAIHLENNALPSVRETTRARQLAMDDAQIRSNLLSDEEKIQYERTHGSGFFSVGYYTSVNGSPKAKALYTEYQSFKKDFEHAKTQQESLERDIASLNTLHIEILIG